MEDLAENKINMASAEDMPGQSDEQVNTYFSDQNAYTQWKRDMTYSQSILM